MPKYKNPWKTLSSKYKYQNPWIKIREDQVIRPDGKRGIYGVLEKPPAVFIVARLDNGKIILVSQFRYTTKRLSWEIPAGSSDGQNPLVAARRELWEETGYRARAWRKLARYEIANGIGDIDGYVFLAEGLYQTNANKKIEDGIESVKAVSVSQLRTMIDLGEIADGPSVIAFYYFLRDRIK